MAGLSLWEKFRFEKKPAKRFKPNSDGEDEKQSSSEAKEQADSRNSFDCLLKPRSKTPDGSSSCRDSSISCIPETPTSLQPSPCRSPVFSGHGSQDSQVGKVEEVDSSQTDTDATCLPGSQNSVPDTTTAQGKDAGHGGDMKRGIKRRFRLMSESAESDSDADTPSKPSDEGQPSSPVFGFAHSALNGHIKHTCSKGGTSSRKKVEYIHIKSDSESGEEPHASSQDSKHSTSDPASTPPGKRKTARMGFSPSRVVTAQKRAYRRIMSLDDSNEESDMTQLEEDKEALVTDLRKRFPKRSREDLINVLVGLEWSLFDAIQTLKDADNSMEESDDEESSLPSGSSSRLDRFAYSKSSREDSGEWISKANPPKYADRTKEAKKHVNGWLSNSSSNLHSYSSQSSTDNTEGSSAVHTCGRARDRRKKPRAVAIPEEYRHKKLPDENRSVKSAKHTCRRRIKQMASSSDEEEAPVLERETLQSDSGLTRQHKENEAVIVVESDDNESKDDESSETNSRTSKTPVEVADDDNDEVDTGIYDDDDDMPTFNKMVLAFFNEATIEELIGIDECSKSKAQKIVAMRPFENFADLLERMEDTRGLGQHLVWNSRGIFQEREVVVFLMNKCACIAERIHAIISSQMDTSKDDDESVNKAQITKEPSTLNQDHKLKPYQMIGLNWLALLHREGVNGILADEMGLGKTVQTIAFLAYLLEQGNNGPHVIVVPSSTLDNWVRELMKWCPALEVLMYSGSQQYRSTLRYDILDGNVPFDVIVTTYNTCTSSAEDRSFFRKLPIQYAIFDEGHMLKNINSNRYQHLMKIKAKRRLLLTGTPLQNNLLELMSLLSFVMPDIFMNKASELKRIFGFQKLKSYGLNTEQTTFEEERIAHAKQIMQPFMLRRVKSEVLKQLPAKKESVEYVEMTSDQQERYDALKASLSQDIKHLKDSGKKGSKMSSALMELRKMANHPMLIRHHYHDEKLKEMAHLMLKEPTHYDADPVLIHEDMSVMTDYELHRLCHEYSVLTPYRLDTQLIVSSGKFQMLDQLLPQLKEKGSRVLLFSQFVMMLDIVEPYMKHHGYKYLRLDGQTQVADRLQMIDKFNSNEDIFVFLLSTRAGGLGINLTAANVVIIHDIDYNPYNDKQAEDRCHRVGQTKDVEVVRLISKHTVEEAMLKCAQYKLRLEEKMTSNKEVDEEDKGDVALMLKDALDL